MIILKKNSLFIKNLRNLRLHSEQYEINRWTTGDELSFTALKLFCRFYLSFLTAIGIL